MAETTTTVVPTSQKAGVRPIGFMLDDGVTGTLKQHSMVVRPEDLTRTETSRVSVQQTLDPGNPAWVDNFGPGLPTINISGHTGWRYVEGQGDGMEQFEKLNQIAFVEWHQRRQRAINWGMDPDLVKLIFADALDDFTWVVVPQNFTLRRSRSRPLLMQYQISLQVVSTDVDVPPLQPAVPPAKPGGSSNDLLADLGLESLADVLANITSLAADIADFVSGTIGALAKGFLELTAKILGVVKRIIGTIKGAIDTVTGAFLDVAVDIMKAGRNLFIAAQSVMSFPDYVKHRFMQVSSAFNAAYCIMKNAFKKRKFYASYGDWYGASTCSSTAGGSPLSPLRNINPFTLLKSNDAAPFYVSSSAAIAISSAAAMDPVLAPSSYSSTTMMMSDITSGVGVNEVAYA